MRLDTRFSNKSLSTTSKTHPSNSSILSLHLRILVQFPSLQALNMGEYLSNATKDGHELLKDWSLPPVSKYFKDPNFSGFMRPVRFEGEIRNLEIIGEIPFSINGTFCRVMPEPQFPASIPNDSVSLNSWLTSLGIPAYQGAH